MEKLYADLIPVESPSECRFYHAIDLPRSGSQKGRWDLRGRFDEYVGGVQFAGKTVLDVGTAGGFLTFEAEKRGAQVVSVDAHSGHDFERIAIRRSLYAEDYDAWLIENNDMLLRTKKAYWLAHRELNSSAKAHYSSIYNLSPELGQFDVVLVGQILVHISDVIRAVTSAANRCADTLVIAEGMIQSDDTISRFLARADAPDNNFSFWHHSTGLYRELMKCLGFTLRSNKTAKYRCNVPGWAQDIDITTLVFQRTS